MLWGARGMVKSNRAALHYYWAITKGDEVDVLKRAGAADVLVSYQYVLREGIRVQDLSDEFDSVLLDSGGFTLRRGGSSRGVGVVEDATTLIAQYAGFIRDCDLSIRGAFNLDLGDAEESYKIFRVLTEDYGLTNILPIWRVTEDEEWLWKYLDNGSSWVGIAGLTGYGPKQDSLVTRFNVISRKAVGLGFGPREFRPHLLGVGASTTIRRLPGTYSVDSSAYSRIGSFAGAAGKRGEASRLIKESHRYGFRASDVDAGSGGGVNRRFGKGRDSKPRQNLKLVAALNIMKELREAGIDVVPRKVIV